MVNSKRIKLIAISSIICVLILLLSLSFLTFYLLSYVLTTIGSILLFLLSIWLLLRLAVQILVFPGSCWFWKRSIEANFCYELSNNVYYKIRDLKQYLKAVQNQERFSLQSNSAYLIESIIDRLRSVSAECKLSDLQSKFMQRLEVLKQVLQETMVIIDSTSSKSMWDWLQERVTRPDPTDIVYEDYPDCHQAKRLISLCCELEEGLLQSCGATSNMKRLKRWVFDDTIGSIDYMREDLKRRYKCEQIWVQSFDKRKIDCLYLPTSPEAPTVLFCNPNAGFYEFAFYQSEWFEFYFKRGINLMFWNYRGFGRSQGKPSVRKICLDGEAVVEFLRREKNVKVLALHGESLGGSVACYLADKCGANFLFADRTFRSLTGAAFYNFGKWAFFGFKASRREDVTVARHFLDARCYKVLSCDPKDNMINDLGSLKTGVATELMYSNQPKTHILLKEHMAAFHKALTRIQHLINQVSNINRDNARVSSKYQPLQEDSGLFENERVKETVLKLKLALNGIEAGGVTLLGSLRSKNSELSLINWVLVLDVWGSSTVVPRSSPIQIAADSLKNIANELEKLMDVNELKKEIEVIHLALKAIKTHLDNRLDCSDTRSLSTSQEFKLEVDYDKAGFLLPLACGHGGPLTNQERFYYEQHLAKALRV